MFLSKKNAAYLNKPPKGKEIKLRVLPGWDEDANDSHEQFQTDYAQQQMVENKARNPQDLGLLDQNSAHNGHSDKQNTSRKIYYNWDELNEMNNIQCEKKLVEGIVEISGVRIKPNENRLAQFANQCKGMDPTYIGSLLMSKIQVNYPFQVKAKALYTIEYLVKKNPIYSNYFKVQSQRLQGLPEPDDNVDNYRKILKSTLNTIGISVANQGDRQENKFNFVDPGYNELNKSKQQEAARNTQKVKKQPTGKKFISPAEMKKHNNKNKVEQKKQTIDLMEDNNQHQKNNDFGLNDLILLDSDNTHNSNNTNNQKNSKNKNNNHNINFDDLLSGSSQQNKTPAFDFTL